MADAERINDFLVDAYGRISKIEERAMTTGLGSAISITEIHIIEKIGLTEPARMSEIAHLLGYTTEDISVQLAAMRHEIGTLRDENRHLKAIRDAVQKVSA